MAAVVSDAGPLIHLAQIGKINLLKQLFGKVHITAEVKAEAYDEGIRLGCKDANAIGEALAEGWLKIEPVPEGVTKTALKMSKGENISKADAATLMLAVEKNAELLVDDKLLSDLAKMYKLKLWSTWTLLLEGLSKKYLKLNEIEQAVTQLGKKKFRLNSKQVQEILDAANQIEKHKEL